jgi:glycerophosphoryl diester phosphodiesterase
LIIAHRGSSATAPENTFRAFREAEEAGADVIELDVRMTRDGELVVFHDRGLKRTAGVRGRVVDCPSSVVKRLDAGKWYGREFRGERIPFLRDVLRALRPETGLNIEVKTDGDRGRIWVVARALCRLLGEKPQGGRILISSFDHVFLRRFHHLCPRIPIGALYMPVRDLTVSPARLCHRCGATMFICSRNQIRKRQIINAREHHLGVIVYGVERRRHLARLRRFGVDAMMTNDPRKLRRFLEES